jgi:MFS transporter, putative metabolite:H+ symporter
MPAFIFLAGSGLLVGLAFTFLGVEPHGRPVSLFGGNRAGTPTPERMIAKTAA